MGKEMWLHAYECTLETLAETLDVEYEEAEIELNKLLEKDPNYLNDYWY